MGFFFIRKGGFLSKNVFPFKIKFFVQRFFFSKNVFFLSKGFFFCQRFSHQEDVATKVFFSKGFCVFFKKFFLEMFFFFKKARLLGRVQSVGLIGCVVGVLCGLGTVGYPQLAPQKEHGCTVGIHRDPPV